MNSEEKVVKRRVRGKSDNTKTIKKVLTKKAKGFVLEEVSEEYVSDNGNLTLVKRKVTTKEIAPDVNAVRALIEIDGLEKKDTLSEMTDEELIKEKNRLIKLLDAVEDSSFD